MRLGSRALRVVMVWHGEPLEERLFDHPQRITLGPSRKDTFVVPASRLGEEFPLFRPASHPFRHDSGFVLTLAAGMSGKVCIDRVRYAVAEFVAKLGQRQAGPTYEQPLTESDWGIVGLDDSGDIAFFFQFVVPSPGG